MIVEMLVQGIAVIEIVRNNQSLFRRGQAVVSDEVGERGAADATNLVLDVSNGVSNGSLEPLVQTSRRLYLYAEMYRDLLG